MRPSVSPDLMTNCPCMYIVYLSVFVKNMATTCRFPPGARRSLAPVGQCGPQKCMGLAILVGTGG